MIRILLKTFKHLYYDIIPDFYNVKWYKNDFDNNFDYYFWLPFRYLVMLIISLFDINIIIYRILFIFGFIKGLNKNNQGERK